MQLESNIFYRYFLTSSVITSALCNLERLLDHDGMITAVIQYSNQHSNRANSLTAKILANIFEILLEFNHF